MTPPSISPFSGVNNLIFQEKIMGIFNKSASASASNSTTSVKDYNYYIERGFNIISLNIGSNHRYLDNNTETNKKTPLISNKGRISFSEKDGEFKGVFFTGQICGFKLWSKSKNQFIDPPAVSKGTDGLDKTDPDAKPTGFVGVYMISAINILNSAYELFDLEGEDEEAEKCNKAIKEIRNLDFLVRQEISFDIPCTKEELIRQQQRLDQAQRNARREGRSAGALQSSLVLAVKLEVPKAGVFQPIIKVHEIISWEEAYMPLPVAGKLTLSGEDTDQLMKMAEELHNEEEAQKALDKSMAKAVLNLVNEGGTNRTRANNKRRDAYRKAKYEENKKKEEEQKVVSKSEEEIEEINEIDLEELGSMSM
jgi:hypothetical protein